MPAHRSLRHEFAARTFKFCLQVRVNDVPFQIVESLGSFGCIRASCACRAHKFSIFFFVTFFYVDIHVVAHVVTICQQSNCQCSGAQTDQPQPKPLLSS